APAAAGPAVTGWKESNSAEGGYSVSLPTNGKVLNSKQTVQLPTGQKLEFNTNGVEFTNDSGMMVAYADMSKEVMTSTSDQRFEVVKQMILGMLPGSKIVKEDKIQVDKYEGREFTIEVAGKGTGKARVFFTENRLYEILAAGPGDFHKSADAKKFFDSFKM